MHAPTLPAMSTQASTLPVVFSQVLTLPAASTRAFSIPTVSTEAFLFPVLTSQVYTRPVMSMHVPEYPASFLHRSTPSSSQVPRFTALSSRVSLSPVGPPMFSAPSNFADLSSARVGHSYDPVVPLHNSIPGQSAAANSYNYAAVSSVTDASQRTLPTPQSAGPNLLAMIAATMEKINADHGLPALEVVKFDGSPENYPMFRQWFYQMVESKALDESTKMSRLLRFLEGPALIAVRRYESVPGGLAKALQVLQDRFGQPFKIVGACVDTLVKGPAIAPQDKNGLQGYADTAQVMYDTLDAINCLGEMNTDNLEKMIPRLTKWAQAKFREHLSRAPKCGKPHHTLLHLPRPSPERSVVHQAKGVETSVIPTVSMTPSDGQNVPSSACATATMVESSGILLQIIPHKVIGNNRRSITTYGLVDSGSDVTMIDPSLIEQLEFQGEVSQLSLSTVNEREKREKGVKVNFKIAPVADQDSREIAVCGAWVVKDLTIPLKHVSVRKKLGQWPHLCQAPFPEVVRNKLSVLIGTNVQEVFIPLEVKKGDPNELFAIRSCLGWSILGGSASCSDKHQFNLNHVSCEEISLSRQVEDFWRVESYGTERQSLNPMSVEDHKALKIIERTISKVDGHYQMGLLWKLEDPSLPFNRAAAEASLQHLKRRFTRDPSLEFKYRAVIDDYKKVDS